jgi:hypothetical protein
VCGAKKKCDDDLKARRRHHPNAGECRVLAQRRRFRRSDAGEPVAMVVLYHPNHARVNTSHDMPAKEALEFASAWAEHEVATSAFVTRK